MIIFYAPLALRVVLSYKIVTSLLFALIYLRLFLQQFYYVYEALSLLQSIAYFVQYSLCFELLYQILHPISKPLSFCRPYLHCLALLCGEWPHQHSRPALQAHAREHLPSARHQHSGGSALHPGLSLLRLQPQSQLHLLSLIKPSF